MVPACPSCGGREAVRQRGRFACAFCGARIVPRLEPGTLCGDDGGAGFCSDPAESLCRYCARPLCDRHDAPKRYYWTEPLSWRVLCPRWSARDGADWGRLNGPFQRFPIEGFEPFEWTPHDQPSLYAIGRLEDEITTALAPLVQEVGGSVDEQCCAFQCLCNDCEGELTEKIDELANGYAERYRRVALVERLDALEAEARQALRYVEAYLRRPVASRPSPAARDGHLDSLDLNSRREEWDAWGHKLQARLETVARLQGRLGRQPD